MSYCAKTTIEREFYMGKWKENKCYNYEKKPNMAIKDKLNKFKQNKNHNKALIKNKTEIIGQGMNFHKNGQNLQNILRLEPERVDNIKEAPQLTLSEFMQRICADIDPEQGIEDQYKNKHQPTFSWRFLRLISQIDLVNFHGKPQEKQTKYEGNIEE